MFRRPTYFNHLLLITAVLLCAATVRGQVRDDLNLKLQSSIFLQEKTSANTDHAPYLTFPNLNKIKYFNPDQYIKRIAKAEEEDDIMALDTLLSNFVASWGIGNFMTNIDYLWKAGQVKELLGDSVAAGLYYELGLKNQRPIHPSVKIHYDSLRARTNVEWVDLQFYYKILEARRIIDPLIPPKGVMLNMGPKVNSDRPDYAPFMHPSDSVLIFTSRRDEEIVIDNIHEHKNEDLYFVEKGFVDGTWTYASRFTSEINSEYNEGSATLSRDGRTLFFTRCDAPNGIGSCDLYIAEFVGGGWTNIRNLGPNVNSDAWDSHPNITPDGNTLIFTSNRKGGFGTSDLYMTQRYEDGSWSPAANLGPTINTVEDEVTPFFHQVNSTLYFSSTGHLKNVGGYDIYKSRWLGDHWEAPKNLGPLVNSSGNEYYFSIDGKGTRLFYASAKKDQYKAQVNQNFELYSFPMPMEARPDAIVTLRGTLIDSISGNPLVGIVLVIDRDDQIEVAPKHINRYGYFEFDLINSHKYDIYIQGDNFLSIKEDITVLEDTTFTVFANSFETGKPLVFENLEFEDDSYALNSSIEPKLNYLVNFLKKYPMFRLEVIGHTDSDGEAKYNLDLSRKRAAIIAKYIAKNGDLADNSVVARGYGETRPLVPNDTEEHKHMNRRVEFEVWLDPSYAGPMILPTADEFSLGEEEELYDEEFLEEAEWDWEGEDFDDDWDWDETEDDEDLLKEFDDFGIIDPE
jgi:outer membrane protein OmpA-like peptidoglycan-associated protein